MVGSRNRASGSKSTNNYRTNKNGYLVDNTGDHIENFIMYNKIHKNRAIGIPAINKSTGIVHMFDAIGLYKWFFEQNNKELLGYISHLTKRITNRVLFFERLEPVWNQYGVQITKNKKKDRLFFLSFSFFLFSLFFLFCLVLFSIF